MGRRSYLARSRHLLPVAAAGDGRLRRGLTVLQGAFVLALFDVNDALITRWGGALPDVWEAADFPWTGTIERAAPGILAEYERYRAGGGRVPHVAEIAGLEPGTREAIDAAPVDRGVWRTLILVANGSWVREIVDEFPDTSAALAACPQMTTVGFSVLEGRGEDNAAPPQGDLRMMSVTQLAPGKYQPRSQMDSESLQELADSIRAQGLMQPILVREVAEGYEIIAGERRWRAAQLAGLNEIPVLVREVADSAVAAMALIENIQREDLNAIDEAHGLQRLIQEFGMTHEAVAQSVGKSRAAVSNLLRLLNLSRPVQDMLVAGLIEMGHARALLPLHAGVQRELAHEIETRGLSVREVERRVARLKEAPSAPTKQTVSRDTLRLEEALADALGMTAQIQANSKGSGKLTLHFGSADVLDGLLARLGIKL